MTEQTKIILAIVSSFIGGGGLVSIVGFFVYRKRTRAETRKIDAEAEAKLAEINKFNAEAQAKLAEAKNLEAQAANTLSDAVSDIVAGFKSLIEQSESRCKARISALEKELEILKESHKLLEEDNQTMKENYLKLKESYHELKNDYALLLIWAKDVADFLNDNKIPYPDPPKKNNSVLAGREIGSLSV